jgi:hypothetical protein
MMELAKLVEAKTLAAITAAFNAYNASRRAGYDPETIQAGDIIEFYHRPYQHCAQILITKVNRKTLKGIEIKNSYSPGTNWTVSKNYSEIRMSRYTTPR